MVYSQTVWESPCKPAMLVQYVFEHIQHVYILFLNQVHSMFLKVFIILFTVFNQWYINWFSLTLCD